MKCPEKASCWSFRSLFLLLLLAVVAAGTSHAASLRESWAFYIQRVKSRASVQEREQILNRILENPDFADQDLSLVKKELHRVRTDVAFAESMRYYEAQVKAGIPKEKQIVYLKAIVAKYEARGMDMSDVKAELERVRRPPSAAVRRKTSAPPEPEARPTPEPEAEEPPPVPRPESYKSVSILAGLHLFPSETFFDTHEALFDAGDFRGPAFVLGFRQRFAVYGWGVEAGQYGKSHDYSAAVGTNTLTGTTELGAAFVRVSANYHFLPEERPVDLSLSFGLGPYFWKKKTDETLNTSPEGRTAADASGTVLGFHLGARAAYRVASSLEIFLEDSYAFASEGDPEKIRSSSDEDVINFGGHVLGLGAAYRW